MIVLKKFITFAEQARRFETCSMFWDGIASAGRVEPHQWGLAAVYAEDPSTCPYIFPWLQDSLNFVTTSDNLVHVEFATIKAREACRWLAQAAYEERNSRFMERFYNILHQQNQKQLTNNHNETSL